MFQCCCEIMCDTQWWSPWSIGWACTSRPCASSNTIKQWPMKEHELSLITCLKLCQPALLWELYKCHDVLDLCIREDSPLSYLNHWFMLWRGGVYGNCWITAWTSDWSPEVSTESAAGAQVKAIQLWDRKEIIYMHAYIHTYMRVYIYYLWIPVWPHHSVYLLTIYEFW